MPRLSARSEKRSDRVKQRDLAPSVDHRRPVNHRRLVLLRSYMRWRSLPPGPATAVRLSAIEAADAGRSRGSGEIACKTTRSSNGLTSGTSADGRRGPLASGGPWNGRCPVTSSYRSRPTA
jgi:hypothetical protein